MTSLPDYDDTYRQASAPEPQRVPWNIGEPQPAIAALIEAGKVTSPVLDAGCGIGETTLELARRGYTVLGVDSSPTAIAHARATRQPTAGSTLRSRSPTSSPSPTTSDASPPSSTPRCSTRCRWTDDRTTSRTSRVPPTRKRYSTCWSSTVAPRCDPGQDPTQSRSPSCARPSASTGRSTQSHPRRSWLGRRPGSPRPLTATTKGLFPIQSAAEGVAGPAARGRAARRLRQRVFGGRGRPGRGASGPCRRGMHGRCRGPEFRPTSQRPASAAAHAAGLAGD